MGLLGLAYAEPGKKQADKKQADEEQADEEQARARKRWFFAYRVPRCATVFPGFAGNVLLGGLAAVVNWGLYGPFSGFAVVGAPPDGGSQMVPFLTVGQLAVSIVLGIGGPGFLLAEASRRCCERTNKKDCPSFNHSIQKEDRDAAPVASTLIRG